MTLGNILFYSLVGRLSGFIIGAVLGAIVYVLVGETCNFPTLSNFRLVKTCINMTGPLIGWTGILLGLIGLVIGAIVGIVKKPAGERLTNDS